MPNHLVTWCAFAADGRRILTIEDIVHASPGRIPDRPPERCLRFWRADNGTPLGEVRAPESDLSRTLSEDGRLIATLTTPAQLDVWRTDSCERVCSLAHDADVRHWVLSPDARWIVSATGDGCVRVWEVTTGRSPAAYRIAAAFDKKVLLSPDGSRLLMLPESDRTQGDKYRDERMELQAYDVRAARPAGRFFVSGDVSKTVWSRDSRRFAAVTYSGLLYLLELEGLGEPVPLWSP